MNVISVLNLIYDDIFQVTSVNSGMEAVEHDTVTGTTAKEGMPPRSRVRFSRKYRSKYNHTCEFVTPINYYRIVKVVY